MRIVTLCGSLRAASSNRAILAAYARLLPPGTAVEHYEGLGTLPHFNPDLDSATPPAEVGTLRAAMAAADAVIISAPEYAHGLPGAFKNALDWLVSDPAFAGKPVVILHAARGSTHALDSLKEILRTMSARILEPACVLLPLGTNQVTTATFTEREDLRRLLAGSVSSLLQSLNSP